MFLPLMYFSKNNAATCAGTVCAQIEQLISAFPLIVGLKDMYINNILNLVISMLCLNI